MSTSHACNPIPKARICGCPKFDPLAALDACSKMTFEGTCSYDPDNGYPYGWGHGITEYQWDIWCPPGKSDYERTYDPPDKKEKMYCKFSHTGKYKVRLRVKDDDGLWSHGPDPETWTSCNVYVFKMHLDIEGVLDSEEEDPGGFLHYNHDDDNNNSTPDKDDPGTVTGEDDLRAIFLGYEPPELEESGAYLELKILYEDNDIRVWTHSDKGSMVLPDDPNYYKRWLVGSELSPLWVEAHEFGPALLQLLLTPDKKYPWYPGGGHNSDLVKFTAFMCDVTSADVCQDKIYVCLWGQGATGTLKLELTGPGGSHTIREETRSYGCYSETFDIPNLTVGEYTKVKATWTVDGFHCIDEFDYRIKVLGVYRHSVYNLPKESCYSGSNEDFCYTAGNCTATSCSWSTDGSAKSDWLDAVQLNGSGYSSSLGYVTREGWCQKYGTPPPEGCNGDLLRDLSITGGCPECIGQPLTANETVAVIENHPDLDCGDRVCVHEVGTRTVTDKGTLPNGQQQLDHFVGLQDCGTTYDDIGNKMTIKLLD